MSEQHGDPRFYALLEELADLHARKNHDYAKSDEPLSNFTRSRALGVEPWRAVLIRMSDKWSRIEQLSGAKVPKNESMRDSLIDLAAYSLLSILLYEDEHRVALVNGRFYCPTCKVVAQVMRHPDAEVCCPKCDAIAQPASGDEA